MSEVDLTAPITPEEYELLAYRRKAFLRTTGTSEELPFIHLCQRFQAQFPTTPERIAWHEAGHAVVSHRLGYVVWMIKRKADHGQAYTEQQPEYSDDWALVKVAGYLAEDRRFSNIDPVEASAVADMAEDLFDFGPDERKAFVEEIEDRSLAILKCNWDAVERVAELVKASKSVKRAQLDIALADVPFRTGGVMP